MKSLWEVITSRLLTAVKLLIAILAPPFTWNQRFSNILVEIHRKLDHIGHYPSKSLLFDSCQSDSWHPVVILHWFLDNLRWNPTQTAKRTVVTLTWQLSKCDIKCAQVTFVLTPMRLIRGYFYRHRLSSFFLLIFLWEHTSFVEEERF